MRAHPHGFDSPCRHGHGTPWSPTGVADLSRGDKLRAGSLLVLSALTLLLVVMTGCAGST